MRASHYAHALYSLVLEHPTKEDELVSNLTNTLRTNGHEHLTKKVIRSLEKLIKRKGHMSTIEVVTSKKISEDEVQALFRKTPYSKILSTKHKHVIRKIDDSIIGGTIVRTGNQRVDKSYKRALLDLYQNITK